MRIIRVSVLVGLTGVAVLPAVALAQAEGAVAGRVYDATSRVGLAQAQVLVDGRLRAITDPGGIYRVRGIRSGWHRISARMIGYRSVVRDSVFVSGGATVTLDFGLERNPLELDPLVVTAPVRPGARSAGDRHRAEDQRRGSARPAGELAGGGARAFGRQRGHELPGRPPGRGIVHPRRPGRQESARRVDGGLGLRIPPTRSARRRS